DCDPAVCIAHVRKLGLAELAQIKVDALARAAALRGQAGRARHDHALFMEQSVEQASRRKHRIKQLVILYGGGEVTAAVPVLLILVLALGRSLLARAARARQLLDHQAAGAPVPGPRALAVATLVVPRHSQADEGRQLF